MKHLLKDLANLLHRPVKSAGQSGRWRFPKKAVDTACREVRFSLVLSDICQKEKFRLGIPSGWQI